MSSTRQTITKKTARLPSGVTVEQAKKDAKHLAKSENRSRAEALDQIAFLHGRSDWSALMAQLSKQSMLTYRFNDKTLTIPEDKSVTLIVGQAGSGKSSLLAEMAVQLLSNGHKVLIIAQDRIGISHRNCTIMNVSDKAFDISALRIDGAVVLIDDIQLLHERGIMVNDVTQFFRCVRHVIVASDDMFDLRYLKGNLGILMRVLHLQNFAIRDTYASMMNMFLGEYRLVIDAVDGLKKDRYSCEFAMFDGGETATVYSFNNSQMNVGDPVHSA